MAEQQKKQEQTAPQNKSRPEAQAEAEEQLIAEEQKRIENERIQAQEEQEKRRVEQRKLAQKIFDTGPEGMEVKENNAEDVEALVNEGHAHIETAQSGPGGLEVKRYAYLTAQGEGFR